MANIFCNDLRVYECPLFKQTKSFSSADGADDMNFY